MSDVHNNQKVQLANKLNTMGQINQMHKVNNINQSNSGVRKANEHPTHTYNKTAKPQEKIKAKAEFDKRGKYL